MENGYFHPLIVHGIFIFLYEMETDKTEKMENAPHVSGRFFVVTLFGEKLMAFASYQRDRKFSSDIYGQNHISCYDTTKVTFLTIFEGQIRKYLWFVNLTTRNVTLSLLRSTACCPQVSKEYANSLDSRMILS